MDLIQMVFQSLPSIALFVAILTSVGECSREMLGLDMIPHMIPCIVAKLIAKSAAIPFVVIFGNKLHQIIWCHRT